MRLRWDISLVLFLVWMGVVLVLPPTLLGLAATSASGAQAPNSAGGEQNESATVSLGTVAVQVGSTATIPLYYSLGGSNPLRSFHMEVEFVSNSVKFTKAEKGVAAEAQEFDLAVEAKELPPDDKKIVRTHLNIDLSMGDADPSKSLPEGLWAYLYVDVPANAKAFSIVLTPTVVSAQDSSKKPVKVAGEAGKIIVSGPIGLPLPTCFFFNH